MMTGAAYAVSPETGTSGAVSFSVNLREWFVLEVQTPDVHMESSGAAGAGVTTTMSPDGIPARIKALAVVAHNQTVELKVQVFGDLVGPLGRNAPALRCDLGRVRRRIPERPVHSGRLCRPGPLDGTGLS